MIEIDLALIGTALAIVASIWKFANSISKFGHSVDELRKSMQESIDDRRDLRKVLNEHAVTIGKIETQYGDIKEDLDEIKRRVS